MKYFQQFPSILYSFSESKNQFFTVTNIFARVELLNSIMQNIEVFYQYAVQDGDTPEIVASKYYSDPNRYWMVLFANQMIDPYFDWILNQNDFNNNIVKKYGDIGTAQGTLHHVNQQQIVTTTLNGTSNTLTYISTANSYSYNFQTKQLSYQTLPTIGNPIIDLGSTAVGFLDGYIVTTDTSLLAISSYDYEDQQNELKRQITLIDKQYAGQLESELKKLLST